MNRNALSRKIRTWARHIVDAEITAANTSEPDGPAITRVFDGLRRSLSALVGVNGFSVVLSRALALGKAEIPGLTPVNSKPDGSLEGLSEIPREAVYESSTALVAYLLGLLTAFIGESLLLQVLQDTWPGLALSQNALSEEIEND